MISQIVQNEPNNFVLLPPISFFEITAAKVLSFREIKRESCVNHELSRNCKFLKACATMSLILVIGKAHKWDKPGDLPYVGLAMLSRLRAVSSSISTSYDYYIKDYLKLLSGSSDYYIGSHISFSHDPFF